MLKILAIYSILIASEGKKSSHF